MNWLGSLKWRPRTGAGLKLVMASICAASVAFVIGGDTKANAKPEKNTPKKPLDGAALYSTHCNRCHAERYATERTDAQWKTIMLHMQTRGQVPGKDAKAILKYLQENN